MCFLSKVIIMNDILIRSNIQCGDIGSVIFLHGKYAAIENGYDFTFEAYVAEPLSQFVLNQNEREKIWLVEYNDQVSGSIAICQNTNSVAQLRWFILAPQLRGKKIGSKLLSAAISFAKKSGYSTVQLWTESNLGLALGIYENLGFKLTSSKTVELWGSERQEQNYTLELNT